MLKKIFVFSILLVFVINISYFKLFFGSTFIGWLGNAMYLIALPILLSSIPKKGNKVEWLYIGVMILGLVFHAFLPESEKHTIKDSLQWLFLVVLIIASQKYKAPQLLFYTLLAFFITNCVLAMVEYKLQANLFDYRYVEGFSNFTEKSEFRAFGLMEHPLQSANITLIIMSFIMISKDIKRSLKIVLLTLGTLAVLCFNSRFAIIICFCMLAYRYLLYNVKPVIAIMLGVLVYALFLSDITSFIQQNSQIFGRLAEKNNLSDDSSLTRLLSYLYFWNADWNLQNIVLGGRIIYIPGTEYSLENGVLLTISWWGWVVGILKVILELIISYLCLKNYNVKDKWIVMIACWGTAFANNNSMFTFVFAFFIISFLSIDALANQKKNKKAIKISQVLFVKSKNN
jgi:hypothetical protein